MATWDEVSKDILARLDIQKWYEGYGIRFTNAAPNKDGWLRCNALRDGDEDKRASAAVNVGDNLAWRGRYKDSGTGTLLSLFDFAVRFGGGKYESHVDVKRDLAEQLGIDLPAGRQQRSLSPSAKKKPRTATERLSFCKWSDNQATIYCKKRRGISVAGLLRAGARLAEYPANAPHANRQLVLAFPIFDMKFDAPVGWVISSINGEPIFLYQGPGEPPEPHKVLMVPGSKTGFIGKHTKRFKEWEIVWKVEGLTDMLSLLSVMPDEYRRKHGIVTNAGGSNEKPHREWTAIFEGRPTFVVHDADVGGRVGREEWCRHLQRLRVAVTGVELPYPETKKHGRDLRDWIVEGHTYHELLTLGQTRAADTAQGEAARPEEPAAVPNLGRRDELRTVRLPGDLDADTQQILDALDIDVIGEDDKEEIEIWSKTLSKMATIKNIDKVKRAELIQKVGIVAKELVFEGRDAPGDMIGIREVREAIALAASGRRIDRNVVQGAGPWPAEDGLLCVNSHAAVLLTDSSSARTIIAPHHRGKILNFDRTTTWYEEEELVRLVDVYRSSEKAANLIAAITQDAAQWLWQHPYDPSLVVALMATTWVQSVWTWRPQVSITGESDSGKSTFMEWLKDHYGDLAASVNRPTEAGLRQLIEQKLKVVLIDEFEKSKHRDSVLELIRTSSRGAHIVTGTAGQRARIFGMRHIVWVAGIETGLRDQADRNRFVSLEMKPMPPGRRGNISVSQGEEARRNGLSLFAAVASRWRKAVKLAEALRSHVLPGVPGRIVECYSTPAAMYSCLLGLETLPEAQQQLVAMIGERYKTDSIDADQDLLLQSIFQSAFLSNGQRYTVAEVLRKPYMNTQVLKEMETYGVGLVRAHRGPRGSAVPGSQYAGIFVNTHAVERDLFRMWDKHGRSDLDAVLSRLKDASRDQRSLASSRCRGVFIPWPTVATFLSSEEDENDGEMEEGLE